MKIATVARMVGFGCAAVLLYEGVRFFEEGAKEVREVEAAQTAIRVRMPIDLSKPGEYRGTLHETFLNSHGSSLEIETTPAFQSAEQVNMALDGAEGKFKVVAEDGSVIAENDLGKALGSSGKVNSDGTDRWTPALFGYMATERGEIQLIVNVTTPAAGMAGRKQEVVGRYRLCGMEQMPAFIGYFFGGWSTLAGMTVALISWRWRRRKRERVEACVA